MRILVAVSTKSDNECADPVSLIASFPWPQATTFQVITVAEVVHTAMVDVVPGTFDSPEIQGKADSLAADIAESSAARLRDHGLKAESFSAEGNPQDLITDHAKQWNADLIVVGACDRSRIERFFLGSVSQSVVEHAPCSVLVVKPAAIEENTVFQMEHGAETSPVSARAA